MNKNDLKELINLANHLDEIGERKIASKLDSVIKKASSSSNKIAEGSAFAIAGKSETPGAERVRKQREPANMPEEESLMPMPSDNEKFAGDPLFSEASKAEQRISKIASLLSGEFGGLEKSVRR